MNDERRSQKPIIDEIEFQLAEQLAVDPETQGESISLKGLEDRQRDLLYLAENFIKGEFDSIYTIQFSANEALDLAARSYADYVLACDPEEQGLVAAKLLEQQAGELESKLADLKATTTAISIKLVNWTQPVDDRVSPRGHLMSIFAEEFQIRLNAL